jgi:hypothetical protein
MDTVIAFYVAGMLKGLLIGAFWREMRDAIRAWGSR